MLRNSRPHVTGHSRTANREAVSLEDFPYLEDEDIDACLQYAAAEADHPVLATS